MCRVATVRLADYLFVLTSNWTTVPNKVAVNIYRIMKSFFLMLYFLYPYLLDDWILIYVKIIRKTLMCAGGWALLNCFNISVIQRWRTASLSDGWSKKLFGAICTLNQGTKEWYLWCQDDCRWSSTRSQSRICLRGYYDTGRSFNSWLITLLVNIGCNCTISCAKVS